MLWPAELLEVSGCWRGPEKRKRVADEETSSRAKAVTLTMADDVVCITFICGLMNDSQSEPIQIYTTRLSTSMQRLIL